MVEKWELGVDEPKRSQVESSKPGPEKQPSPSSETIQKQDPIPAAPAMEKTDARQLALDYVHSTMESWKNRPTLKQRKADEVVRRRWIRVLTAQLDLELERIKINKEEISKKLKESIAQADKLLENKVIQVRKQEKKEKSVAIRKREKAHKKIDKECAEVQKLSNDWFDARISEVSQPNLLSDYASDALKKKGLTDAVAIEANIKNNPETAEHIRTKIEVFEQKRAVNSKRIYDEADQKKKNVIDTTNKKIANIEAGTESSLKSLNEKHEQTIKSAKDAATQQTSRLVALEAAHKDRFITESAKLADASQKAKSMSFLTEAALLARFNLSKAKGKTWVAAAALAIGVGSAFAVYTMNPVDYTTASKTLIQQNSQSNIAPSEFRLKRKRVDEKLLIERKAIAEKEAVVKAEKDKVEAVKKSIKAAEDKKTEIENRYNNSIRSIGTWFLNAKIKENDIQSVASVISSLNVLDSLSRNNKIQPTDEQKGRIAEKIYALFRIKGEVSASDTIALKSMIESLLNPTPKPDVKVVPSSDNITKVSVAPTKIDTGPKVDQIITAVKVSPAVSKSSSTFSTNASSATLSAAKPGSS